MQLQLDALQQQIAIVEQYEALFASQNATEFNRRLGGNDLPGTFLNTIKRNQETTQQVARTFNFASYQSTDERRKLVLASLRHLVNLGTEQATVNAMMRTESKEFDFFMQSIQIVKNYFETSAAQATVTTPTGFFDYASNLVQSTIAVASETVYETQATQAALLGSVRQLISAQKLVLQNAVQQTQACIQSKAEATITSVKKIIVGTKLKKSLTKLKKARDEKLKAEIAVGETRIRADRRQQATAAAMAFGKKSLPYIGMGAMFATGAGLATISGLMQFHPAFAVLVGVHLPVAALATFAAAGLAMTATAAYLAYRAYHPTAEVVVPAVETAPVVDTAPVVIEPKETTTPVVANSLYPKLVTAGLMTSGLGLAGFSALVQFSPILTQFSPNFALLAGLHLPPAALIAIAAVGALLVSIALYRVCKSYMQARADAAVETPAADASAVQTTEPCYTRAYKYAAASCCFKLFGGAAKPATEEKTTQQIIADRSAFTV